MSPRFERLIRSLRDRIAHRPRPTSRPPESDEAYERRQW